jgi:hypothetical protein
MISEGSTAVRRFDRVRDKSPARINERIDRSTEARIAYLATQPQDAIVQRMTELGHESDIERVLQINDAVLGLAGLALGATVDRRWLLLPAAVLAFMLQHAVQGWCPLLWAYRALGVRTAREIDAEKCALLALQSPS